MGAGSVPSLVLPGSTLIAKDIHQPGSEIVEHDDAHRETERERYRKLVGLIATREANAGRLGFDPEEMYKPLMKPIRSVSHAG